MCLLFLSLAQTARATDVPTTGASAVQPWLDATFKIGDTSLVTGLEIRTKRLDTNSWGLLSVRPAITLTKAKATDSSVSLDKDTSAIGGEIAIDAELGHLDDNDGVGVFGLLLKGTVSEAEFTYYPDGQTEADEWKPNLGGEVRLRAMITHALKAPTDSIMPADGSRPEMRVSDHDDLILYPQLIASVSSAYTAGDTVGVIQPVMANGLQTTKDMVIESPTQKIETKTTLAFAVRPPRGPFAYALAAGSNYNLTDGVWSEHRAELWTYMFALDGSATSARLGAAPFVKSVYDDEDTVRILDGGVVFAFRVGTVRLEY